VPTLHDCILSKLREWLAGGYFLSLEDQGTRPSG
jgi:hypothetical protein